MLCDWVKGITHNSYKLNIQFQNNMTLKSHYIYYNTLWPANTLFTSKYWVYGLCVFSTYAVMTEIKLYCFNVEFTHQQMHFY